MNIIGLISFDWFGKKWGSPNSEPNCGCQDMPVLTARVYEHSHPLFILVFIVCTFFSLSRLTGIASFHTAEVFFPFNLYFTLHTYYLYCSFFLLQVIQSSHWNSFVPHGWAFSYCRSSIADNHRFLFALVLSVSFLSSLLRYRNILEFNNLLCFLHTVITRLFPPGPFKFLRFRIHICCLCR